MTMNADESAAGSDRPLYEPGQQQIAFRAAVLDVIVGTILTLLALGLWIGADYIERSSAGLMGPAGFPRGIALILGATSLLTAIRGVIDLRTGRDDERVTVDQPIPVLVTLLLVVAYPLLISSFGYYLATGPWLVALFFATGNRKPLPMLCYAAGFLIFTKLVFQMLIGIPLP